MYAFLNCSSTGAKLLRWMSPLRSCCGSLVKLTNLNHMRCGSRARIVASQTEKENEEKQSNVFRQSPFSASAISSRTRLVAFLTGVYILIAGTLLLLFPCQVFKVIAPSVTVFQQSTSVSQLWIQIGAVLAQLFGLYYLGEALLPFKGFLLSSVVARMYLFMAFMIIQSQSLTNPKPPLLIPVLSILNVISALSMLVQQRHDGTLRKLSDHYTTVKNSLICYRDIQELPPQHAHQSVVRSVELRNSVVLSAEKDGWVCLSDITTDKCIARFSCACKDLLKAGFVTTVSNSDDSTYHIWTAFERDGVVQLQTWNVRRMKDTARVEPEFNARCEEGAVGIDPFPASMDTVIRFKSGRIQVRPWNASASANTIFEVPHGYQCISSPATWIRSDAFVVCYANVHNMTGMACSYSKRANEWVRSWSIVLPSMVSICRVRDTSVVMIDMKNQVLVLSSADGSVLLSGQMPRSNVVLDAAILDDSCTFLWICSNSGLALWDLQRSAERRLCLESAGIRDVSNDLDIPCAKVALMASGEKAVIAQAHDHSLTLVHRRPVIGMDYARAWLASLES